MRFPNARLTQLLLCCALTCGLPAFGQQAWRYDLRTGDHLLYHYVIDREVTSPAGQLHTESTFNTHVLVLGEKDGRLSIGFQRNRESARLVEYREHGKDKLKQESAEFDQTLAKRPSRFGETNEFSVTGEAFDYWEAARESSSKILMAVHEIEALPTGAVKIGDKWNNRNLLGLEFRYAADETISGKQCARVEGTGGEQHLTYWWCPAIGAIAKIQVDGFYSIYESRVHERLSFELQEKRRSEELADWLKSPDTQLGALDALLSSRWVPIQAALLAPALQSPDVQIQANALAVIYQRNLKLPDMEAVNKLAQSGDAQVKRIATKILNPRKTGSQRVGQCTLPATTHGPEKTGTSLRFMRNDKYRNEFYVLHVPVDYRGDRPLPLLVYLSGGAGTGHGRGEHVGGCRWAHGLSGAVSAGR